MSKAISKSGFPSTEWLKTRYPYDAGTRSKRIEKKVLDHFSGRFRLRILDIGSGLGANIRYYGPLFSSSQEWTLLEIEPRLADDSLEELKAWASREGRSVRALPHGLSIENEDGEISIRMKQASFFDLKSSDDLGRYDLITANAFFDLIPQDRFAAFASILSSSHKPLLATLNYESTKFRPEDRKDRDFIAQYESHMMRSRDIGPSMGPRCCARMNEILTALGYCVYAGKSTWKIPAQDKAMMNFMFGFLEDALGEMLGGSQERDEFDRWMKKKSALLERNRLELSVNHMDFFAKP